MSFAQQDKIFYNKCEKSTKLGATLKAGMTESRNGGKYPQILKDGIAESRNAGKYPQILKDGMTENHPKS